MELRRHYDVIIVGGGVVGSAIAYFLAVNADFDGRVLVVERDASYRECSTARSVGGIRQQFSTAENIAMSLFGAAFVREAPERLAVDGDRPDLAFVENGYLLLATEAGLSVLQENHALQRAQGAAVALLEAPQLAERFPWLEVADLAAGTLGLRNEGWIDPYALLQALRRKARTLGAQYVEDCVDGFLRRGARVEAVRMRAAGEVGCGIVVNAAGARAGEVAAMAGLGLPVRPRKRQVFSFACPERLPDCPLVVDPSGLYFRPEGAGFICGIGPEADADPDSFDLEVDFTPFEAQLWPLLARRVASFEAIRFTGAWAGTYDYNTFDQNAVIGPHPQAENFILANGFSGHGLQQSPAAGRAVSELILYRDYRSLDLSRLGYERIAAGRPLRELNVV